MDWWRIFNQKYALVPLAVPHIRVTFRGGGYQTYKMVFIFGFRMVYWSTNKLD